MFLVIQNFIFSKTLSPSRHKNLNFWFILTVTSHQNQKSLIIKAPFILYCTTKQYLILVRTCKDNINIIFLFNQVIITSFGGKYVIVVVFFENSSWLSFEKPVGLGREESNRRSSSFLIFSFLSFPFHPGASLNCDQITNFDFD